MSIFYSKSKNGFFPGAIRAEYEAAGTWPRDAVEIDDVLYGQLMAGQAAGAVIRPDESGAPVAVAPTPVPFAELAAPFMATVRTTREAILNRLAGIGMAALVEADTATAQAVATARAALLGITEDARVTAATDMDSLKSAVLLAYRDIVAAAPEGLRNAFNGVNN